MAPKPVKPDQAAVEQAEQEQPPEQAAPPPPEPRRPGSVPGPFKINFGFARMHEKMAARTDRLQGVKMELSRDQAAMLEQPPVAMPKLFSKSVISSNL